MIAGERMEEKLKQALKDVYWVPGPVRKTAFLKQHRREIMVSQVKHICRR